MPDPEDQGFFPEGTPAEAEKDTASEWVNDITLVAAVLGAISMSPLRSLTDDEGQAYEAAVKRLGESAGLAAESPIMGQERGLKLYVPNGAN